MRAPPYLLLSAGLAACIREDVASSGATTSAPAAEASSSAAPGPPANLGRSASATVKPDLPMPGPQRRRLRAAGLLNATCVSCHEAEAAEWRGSRHHQSNTNAAYRHAFAVEPSPFCRACHAPESDPRTEPPREVGELGVGCVTCHVTEEGAVLAAPSAGADDRAPSAHAALRRSADFAGIGSCAACHEFRFPGASGDDDGHFMQTTVREHGRSRSAAKPCATCHMPFVFAATGAARPRRSHAFAEVRDPGWLRSQLEVTAERIGDHEIRVTLVQPTPGHGFPTGDLFRRLAVGCEIRGAGGKVLSRDVRYLARDFELIPGSPARQLLRDNRVFDEPLVVELSPEPRAGVISWWVRYERVATVGTGVSPADAKVESEVDLHSGVIQ